VVYVFSLVFIFFISNISIYRIRTV